MKHAPVLLAIACMMMLTLEVGCVGLVDANFKPPPSLPTDSITIALDGTINPSTAPIQRSGDLYTLTDDISDNSIWIQKSGITLNGNGHQLKENDKTHFGSGITLNSTRHVNIQNFLISGFFFGVRVQLQLYNPTVGIWDSQPTPDASWIPKNNNVLNCTISDCKGAGVEVSDASNCVISQNTVTGNGVGVELVFNWGLGGSATQITNNTFAYNSQGIVLQSDGGNIVSSNIVTENRVVGINVCSSNNAVTGNLVTKNGLGILVQGSVGATEKPTAHNQISGNIIAQNIGWGLRLNATQKDNQIFGNSIIENNVGEGLQVSIPMCMVVERSGNEVSINMVSGLGNIWSSGSMGNYWSDYQTRYPNAKQANGIWQTPFYINENNIDQYPLVNPPPQNSTTQQVSSSSQETNPDLSVAIPVLYLGAAVILLVVFACVMVSRKRGGQRAAFNLIYSML